MATSKLDDIAIEKRTRNVPCSHAHPGLDVYHGEGHDVEILLLDKRILKTILLDLIGQDEEPGRTMGPGMPSFSRDTLRRELRQKVEEL